MTDTYCTISLVDPSTSTVTDAVTCNSSSVEELSKPTTEIIQESQIPPSSSSIIIFHPGSRHLYFGRASETSPQTILHTIARRRKKLESTKGESESKPSRRYRDMQFPLGSRKGCGKLPPEVESARLQLCHTLQTSLKSDGSSRFATDLATVTCYNKLSKGELVEYATVKEWEDFPQQEVVVGDDVLKIDPEGDFNIHFPWRRGQLNLHEDIGGSLSSVKTDLEDIWKYCLTEKLGLSLQDIKNFRAVVVIPAMFDKSCAQEIMNVVINGIGFGNAFLIQDHICATFGAGLACATVVDVGDQKISVSCVEDGISSPPSRIELKYGGGDLAIAFWNLISQASFPFQVNLTSAWDVEFINTLKERLCHFDLNRCGPEEHIVVWDKPTVHPRMFRICFGDELLIVPLSYFNADLLRGSISNKAVVVSHFQPSAADDPFDAMYITETSRKGLKETEGDEQENDLEDSKVELTLSQCSKIDTDKLLGIDKAILQSIESCDLGDDVKRRLYSSILIVGGGFKFKGLGSWLEKKISMTIPRIFKSEPIEVITQPKEGDPAVTVWKGAAILATLETAVELWIEKQEWNTCGSRILRERSLCSF